MITIVTPAFNEAANLPLLYESLRAVMDRAGERWEWVVVDDHSSDLTFAVICGLAAEDPRVRGFRLSRNSGSHLAIFCGLSHAQGDAAVCLVADGQNPPEFLPNLIAAWREGAHVVWAARDERESEPWAIRITARAYYFIMRNMAGLKDMPKTGSDYFLVDRQVLNALSQCGERNMSLLALISWMGFRQTILTCPRPPRLSGSSKWSFGRRVKAMIDSLIAFSYMPIRAIALVGLVTALVGIAYSGVIVVNAIFGHPVQGWSELMVVILFIGGIQMMMLAVLGEYLWRALEEVRRRPSFLIENATVDPALRERTAPSETTVIGGG